MRARTELRRRLRTLFAALIGVGAVGYFGVHGILGDRGVGDWFELSGQIARLEQRTILNQGRIDILERRVRLLREESLDLDLLDERARHVLGLARTDEIIVLGE